MNIHICPFAFADAKISYCTLPPFHKDDNESLNLWGILAQREEYGIPELSPSATARIREHGYDAYFLGTYQQSK